MDFNYLKILNNLCCGLPFSQHSTVSNSSEINHLRLLRYYLTHHSVFTCCVSIIVQRYIEVLKSLNFFKKIFPKFFLHLYIYFYHNHNCLFTNLIFKCFTRISRVEQMKYIFSQQRKVVSKLMKLSTLYSFSFFITLYMVFYFVDIAG